MQNTYTPIITTINPYHHLAGNEGIAVLMVPEGSELMSHYEEAAAKGQSHHTNITTANP